MYIPFKNINEKLENSLNKIITNSLHEVDPYSCVKNKLDLDGSKLRICENEFKLEEYESIYLIGTGKAVMPMTAGLLNKLGDFIKKGIIITKHAIENVDLPEKIQVLFGDHPTPSDRSINSTSQLIDLVKSTGEKDLIINLISGGGSSLMTKPSENITLEEIRELTHILLNCGANIQEINTIRKHVDDVKGGGLARIAGNTNVINLIISDVLGNDISMIASGPTYPDHTSFNDAVNIISKYGIKDDIPENIIRHLHKGLDGEIPETLKVNDPINNTKYHCIVGSLEDSVKRALITASDLGFSTQVISTNIIGEAREIGKMCGSILRTLATTQLILPRPAILIGGGETTVKLAGNGKGGRNQEIAFGAMEAISGCEKCVLITLATDGEDGPTDAAGAYVTGETVSRAANIGVNPKDFGKNNDTYHYFKSLGNLVITGPTGTNVNDLVFLITY